MKLGAPTEGGMIWIGIFLFGIAFWWSVLAGMWLMPLHIFVGVYSIMWAIDWFFNNYTITITKNDRNQGQEKPQKDRVGTTGHGDRFEHWLEFTGRQG